MFSIENMTMYRLESSVCIMECTLSSSGVLHIRGQMLTDGGAVVFAANPIARMTNYSGSALPYPSRDIAMCNTPNMHVVAPGVQEFNVEFWYPNAFSSEDRKGLVPPTIFVKANDGVEVRHDLPNPFPLRTLKSRAENPEFFMRRQDLGVQSQEHILRALAEPNPYLY